MKKFILTLIFILFTTTSSYASDDIYLKFIHSQNHQISNSNAKDILNAVKYYAPRYFENNLEEGIIYTLSIIAQESAFRNVNGDEGKSIGIMQVTISTCNIARKFNGISRKLNLIAKWDNIHCGMAEINRLQTKLDGNWDLIIKAYNGGLHSILYPEKYKRANRMTDIYLEKVKSKRSKLIALFES